MASDKYWPFHVMARHIAGKKVIFDIMCDNKPFLKSSRTAHRLTRPEAYAIVTLLNSETRSTRWYQKFQGKTKRSKGGIRITRGQLSLLQGKRATA